MTQKFDLIIIGSGMAGSAAALFAVNRGLKIAQVSATAGELNFASGLIDLLGIYPTSEQKVWENPWHGLAALAEGSPCHPYAILGIDAIRKALSEFLETVDSTAGLKYYGLPDRNVTLATAAGTLKTTWRVPQSMWRGVEAFQKKLPVLFIDFEGMKDYSATMIAEALRSRWPGLSAARIPFPLQFPGDIQNPLVAEALESRDVRAKLAEALRPHLGEFKMIGMPALLGVRSTARILDEMEDRLEIGIFEIPTLPPTVPGIRFQEAVTEALLKKDAKILSGRQAIAFLADNRRCTGVTVGNRDFSYDEKIESDAIILATGRFLGGGLTAGRGGIRETVFNLPVSQPDTRTKWHSDHFLDHPGHDINEAGLEIDDQFRPLRQGGEPAFDNLYAAGSVLAHNDWTRNKSGAGLAIATAYGAVEAFVLSHSRF